MNIVKKTKLSFFLYFSLALLALSSCNVYDTIRIEPIDKESLEKLYESYKTVVIHDNREKKEYILTGFKTENDSLKGVIRPAPEGKTHLHHKKTITPSEVDIYNIPSVIHVYSRSIDLNAGYFAIPISSIRFVEIHEGNTAKSLGRTLSTIAGAAVIIVVGIIVVNVL